ncbi:XRE family transcriptional regulator [Frondihabitans sp. PhB188]|uniref:helix-turn-helix domain-containing protein n=1 Tax=Frondihabitans sp. PhB188 TaxID=2485200 RepID=UPI000FAD9B04|nr:XRE family transcriptional regulator [Frondihabitans sp. PhB188]ROQ40941.1 XRE family transcriptional regulator [Frondihabitans sp. PhB188]
MGTPDELQAEIGQAVRAERTRRGWSMRELAGRAGVSQPFLSNVENARIYPSVPTLYALASALEVQPSDLLPGTYPRHAPLHLPASEGSTGSARLIAGGPGSALESYLFELAPGHVDEPAYAHEGEDVVHVIEGTLDVTVGEDAPVRLVAGESFWHEATAPHAWRVPDDAPAVTRVLLVSGGKG